MHPTTKQIHDGIANSIEGLSEAQMREHPEGKWDTAAILEHLALTYASTARLMKKCLKEQRCLVTSPSFKQRVAKSLVLTLSYIPSGRKAPDRVAPAGISGKEAREMLFANLQEMDAAFAECEKRFGSKAKVADHMVLGPIPISGWRKFHVLHTRHHIKQIDALAKTYARPKSNVAAG
jgi:hypothetical protein